MTMRLRIEHETHYAYAVPVELAHHVAFLKPLEDERQVLEAFEMEVDPPAAHHSTGRDAFGNQRVFFSLCLRSSIADCRTDTLNGLMSFEAGGMFRPDV